MQALHNFSSRSIRFALWRSQQPTEATSGQRKAASKDTLFNNQSATEYRVRVRPPVRNQAASVCCANSFNAHHVVLARACTCTASHKRSIERAPYDNCEIGARLHKRAHSQGALSLSIRGRLERAKRTQESASCESQSAEHACMPYGIRQRSSVATSSVQNQPARLGRFWTGEARVQDGNPTHLNRRVLRRVGTCGRLGREVYL